MKLTIAKQQLSLLTDAIAEAEANGSDEVDLISAAKKLTDDSCKALDDAIAKAEAEEK